MPTSITVPDGYGYVLLVSLGVTPFMSTFFGFLAGSMRKAAKVPYPNYLATPQQVKENKEAYQYTCAQRAHGNFLENSPQTMISMLVAGLVYPQTTAWLGVGWILSRMLYAYGYIYGQKQHGMSRTWGSGFWLFQGGLWGLCCATAVSLL